MIPQSYADYYQFVNGLLGQAPMLGVPSYINRGFLNMSPRPTSPTTPPGGGGNGGGGGGGNTPKNRPNRGGQQQQPIPPLDPNRWAYGAGVGHYNLDMPHTWGGRNLNVVNRGL